MMTVQTEINDAKAEANRCQLCHINVAQQVAGTWIAPVLLQQLTAMHVRSNGNPFIIRYFAGDIFLVIF